MPSLTTNMGGRINPGITVTKATQQEFPLRALYIEALNEYFTEVRFKEEKITLLESLESILRTTPHLICFFDLPQCEEEGCLKLIAKYLGKDSALEQRLRNQIKDDFLREEFLEACAKEIIDTVHIGGVYGRACVWDCARSIAQNIYAKQLGDKHPNIRYHDTAETYRFKNAVIHEDVSEGYLESELTFNQFACFPAMCCFAVDLGHETDISTKGEAQYRGLVGKNYQFFSSVKDSYLPAHYQLHMEIEYFLIGCDLLKLHTFFAGSPMSATDKATDTSENMMEMC